MDTSILQLTLTEKEKEILTGVIGNCHISFICVMDILCVPGISHRSSFALQIFHLL
jgi:hypothetical protein